MNTQVQPAGKGTRIITEHILNQAWAWALGGEDMGLCHWGQALRLTLGWLLCTHDPLDS